MALPLQPGLTPAEVAFLCEMETVTVIPRQRLESLNLIAGPTPALRPPHRSSLPLWLALLLKRQRRANILPPPWLHPTSLDKILKHETETSPDTFSPPPPHPYLLSIKPSKTDTISPPFLPSSTADAPAGYLPYHWLELGEILLEACPDDLPDAGRIRTLLRDLREVRMAKMRHSSSELGGGGVNTLLGVGAMEVSEGRAFIVGVMDGLRKIGSSREIARREREEDEGGGVGDEDEEMEFEQG
ncbi:GINS complex protein-domain-containing protein [Bisporella sp. PMI_857]|nr:GINS complex protein-domain-containing protein [Bisporella sp. PMI_857]